MTHPKREIETSLGNLISDAFAENAETDVMLVGSGSIRSNELGPVVTLRSLLSCFPYDDTLTRFTIQGKELKKIFTHIMRLENRNSEGECYQVNNLVKAIYDDLRGLISLRINGNDVNDESEYTLCIQGYHISNCSSYLNITEEELRASGKTKVVSTSAKEVLEEYLRNHQNIKPGVEGRLIYI